MKAVIAVLLVAVAVANAGLIAAPYSAIAPAPYTALSYAAAPYVAAPYAAAIAPAAYAAPVAYAAHAAYAAPIGAGYTAVTRGAVHTAPLPGHAIGSAHVNVQSAPGTI